MLNELISIITCFKCLVKLTRGFDSIMMVLDSTYDITRYGMIDLIELLKNCE